MVKKKKERPKKEKRLKKEKSLDYLVFLMTKMIRMALQQIAAKPKFSLSGSRMDNLKVSLKYKEDGHPNECRIFMDVFTRTRSRLHICCVVLWRRGKWIPDKVNVTIFSNVNHEILSPISGRYDFICSVSKKTGRRQVVKKAPDTV